MGDTMTLPVDCEYTFHTEQATMAYKNGKLCKSVPSKSIFGDNDKFTAVTFDGNSVVFAYDYELTPVKPFVKGYIVTHGDKTFEFIEYHRDGVSAIVYDAEGIDSVKLSVLSKYQPTVESIVRRRVADWNIAPFGEKTLVGEMVEAVKEAIKAGVSVD